MVKAHARYFQLVKGYYVVLLQTAAKYTRVTHNPVEAMVRK